MAKNLKSAGSRIYSICSPLRLKARGASSLEDGTPLRVNYDSHNGYSLYFDQPRLIERNLIPREEMSMQRIREWMAAHPDEAAKVRAARVSPSGITWKRRRRFTNRSPGRPRAAATYQKLGFTLTPRAMHEDRMGTSNRLAQA
jgi:MltA specific insert domain